MERISLLRVLSLLRRRRRFWAFAPFALATGLGVVRWDPLYEAPRIEGRVEVPAREPGALRVLTLNVAHGRGTAFHQALTRREHIRRNLDAIVRLVRATDADVVALQELDAASAWSGGFDHLDYLARSLGYPYRYHGLHVDRRRPRLAYGTGVLSRFPLAETHNHPFEMNPFDTKGFVYAHVRAPGKDFALVSVHLDFKRDSERRAQLERLSEFLGDRTTERLVVAGDFNCALEEEGILRSFVRRNALDAVPDPLPTFPSSSPQRSLDHVFVRGLSIRSRRAFDVAVSDHLPVLVDLR
ncbi:MAG: hypothetical protein D6731_00150 [Planctomycetota bacterium]|nr:MAG: hypothetical protein D6731_00150 [Planctomycetota bacterium]